MRSARRAPAAQVRAGGVYAHAHDLGAGASQHVPSTLAVLGTGMESAADCQFAFNVGGFGKRSKSPRAEYWSLQLCVALHLKAVQIQFLLVSHPRRGMCSRQRMRRRSRRRIHGRQGPVASSPSGPYQDQSMISLQRLEESVLFLLS